MVSIQIPRRSGDLSRLPLTIDLRAVSVEEGIRAGLSIAVLVAANYALHAPILLEASLGALLTCLCDAGGLLRHRVPALLSFGLIGGTLIAGLGLLRPIGYPLIPLACLGIFAFSLARVYGPAAQQVGNLLSVVLVLSLDRSFASWEPAVRFALTFLGGSLWALFLTVAVWRLHPNRPSRLAVGRVYLALAELCEDVQALLARPLPVETADWERHARAHRRAVRDTIEQARIVLDGRLRTGGTAARPALRTLLRLESADQLFGALIALSDLCENHLDTEDFPAAALITGEVAAALRLLAPHIIADGEGEPAAVDVIAALSVIVRALPAETALRRIAGLALEQLSAALNRAVAEVTTAVPAPASGQTVMAPLQANLTWRSAALRHAARTALVASMGLAITFTWPTTYQHWLTITLILTLQPYYALTLQRAVERIGGTVLGGLFAAALSLVCRTPLAIAAAIIPLSVITLAVRSVNFGLYVACLTPMVVLLVELAAPSHGHLIVAAMRALYTVIGGTLAVAGAALLWPSWEPNRLEQELRNAIESHCIFARCELGFVLGELPRAAVNAARREAGIASNNLEASLSRAFLEPYRQGRAMLESVAVADAALRRMAARVLSLQVDQSLRGDATLIAWRDWIAAVSAQFERPGTARLPSRPAQTAPEPVLAEGLAHIARQLELVARALGRLGP